ncbi:hypothetical protein K504DRAFT_74601 [Pleomassaria siparia CBS 279.74]|uniref:Uncharacterized protein n=1 Tax=Pleomassaria siparia CBS 279.74 TaxID=1314801 RepID=A0A6G1K174_9PLEO|nr:hypothetical protein K504DRAFT_74601 [Pleomassaria siparia CBS 279.74]
MVREPWRVKRQRQPARCITSQAPYRKTWYVLTYATYLCTCDTPGSTRFMYGIWSSLSLSSSSSSPRSLIPGFPNIHTCLHHFRPRFLTVSYHILTLSQKRRRTGGSKTTGNISRSPARITLTKPFQPRL